MCPLFVKCSATGRFSASSLHLQVSARVLLSVPFEMLKLKIAPVLLCLPARYVACYVADGVCAACVGPSGESKMAEGGLEAEKADGETHELYAFPVHVPSSFPPASVSHWLRLLRCVQEAPSLVLCGSASQCAISISR